MIRVHVSNKWRDVSEVFQGERVIIAIYKGVRLVWQSVRSCFGNGFWINDKPWINTDAWRN